MNDRMKAIKAKIQEASQIADKLASNNKEIDDTSFSKISDEINPLIEDIESKLRKNPKQKVA